MPELHDIATPRIELGEDHAPARRRIPETRRQLEQEATQARPEQVGNVTEVLHKRLRVTETLHVRDQLADLNGIREALPPDLPQPAFHIRFGRPRIERSIDLDRAEILRVMREPVLLRQTLVERI